MSAVSLATIAAAYLDAPDAPDADATWEALARIAHQHSGLYVRCPNDPGMTPERLAWCISQYEYYDLRIAIPVWEGEPPEYWDADDNCAFRAWHDREHGYVFWEGKCKDEEYTYASELATLKEQIDSVRITGRVYFKGTDVDAVISALVTEVIGQFACYATSGTFPAQRRVHLPPPVVAAILAGEVTP